MILNMILNDLYDDDRRRQTAEEREQERQAATKYFLSMQVTTTTIVIITINITTRIITIKITKVNMLMIRCPAWTVPSLQLRLSLPP